MTESLKPTFLHIQHSLLTHLQHLWNSDYTLFFDEGQQWNPFRTQKPIERIVSSCSNATIVFASSLFTFLSAMRARVKFCITTMYVPIDQHPLYFMFPIHTSLSFYCLRESIPFFSNPQRSIILLPSMKNATTPVLCFNASTVGSNLVYRVCPEKWGPSSLFHVDLESGKISILNDGNPGHSIYEDPRCFMYKGEPYAGISVIDNYTVGVHTSCKIGILSLTHPEKGPRIPLYGKNYTTGPEKNWGFFQAKGDRLFAIYSYSPWVVIEIHDDTTTTEWIRKEPPPLLHNKTIHGGSCPVLIGNQFWAFARSEGKYICVVFDATTFEICGVCPSISWLSPDALQYMLFYIGSAAMDPFTRTWRCIGGINDAANAILQFPHEDLVKEIQWIQ